MNGEIVQHESGLEFERGGAYKFPTARGASPLRCWGTLLNKPMFRTVEEMGAIMSELDEVEERKVAIEEAGGWTQNSAWKAIVSKKSGKTYSIPSADYAPVQDAQVFGPFYEMARESGLKTVGRVDGVGSGKTSGHIILANPNFRVRILNEYEDDVMLGVRLFNSYNKQRSFGAECFGVRMVCCNYNLWGQLLGHVEHRHYATGEEVLSSLTSLVKEIEKNIPKIQALGQAAHNIALATYEAEDLLWGVKLPPTGIAAIIANLNVWEPMVASGLTNWTLYNAATAWITHRTGSGAALESTEKHTKNAFDLLTKRTDELLERGKKAKEAYREVQAQKEALKIQARQVA